MSLENTAYWNHIVRYFSDALSATEEKELFKWLAANPDYKEDFNQIKIIWETSKTKQKEFQFDVEEIWKNLKPKLQEHSNKTPLKSIGLKPNIKWLKIAAAVILLIGITVLMKNELTDHVAMVTVVTPADSTMSFYLPDGTHIMLNENSTFIYPKAFAENHREVTLSGEAYFDVKRNPKKPFIAYAEDTKTTVLGTAFTIKARGDDDNVEVEVFRGEVELSDADGSEDSKEYIEKHEKGTYNKSTRSTSKTRSAGKLPKWLKKIIKSKPVKYMTKEVKKAFHDVKKEF